MKDGIILSAAAAPKISVANCRANAQEIVKTAAAAHQQGVQLLVFPELCVTAATCGDLFFQKQLLSDAQFALRQICEETANLPMVLVAGCPIGWAGNIYDCAAVISGGTILGFVTKNPTPADGRWFSSAQATSVLEEDAHFLHGVPIGTNLLFQCGNMPSFVLAVVFENELWAQTPAAAGHAAAGATVIACLGATPALAGKNEKYKTALKDQTARYACGYIYANAGDGESTTDMVFPANHMIAENGALLAQAVPFKMQTAMCEIDCERMLVQRRRTGNLPAEAGAEGHLIIDFPLAPVETPLCRFVSPTPFVPQDAEERAERCETIFSIQAAGLLKRMEYAKTKRAVIGVSGGLDSTLTLLATHRAFRRAGFDTAGIFAITMPGFGTTGRTKTNVQRLADALCITLETIDITKTVRSHFEDIGHSEEMQDTAYENAQARMRTMVLMDIANKHGGLVVGTGDLSELALGFTTYNGDHMSMYSLNGSVPKSLMRYMIAHEAEMKPELGEVLRDILATPVSPELLPSLTEEPHQKTEQIVGPYELQDFFLYYVVRWGFSPGKIFRLALAAFAGKYNEETLLAWMKEFYRRFFTSQFKRSCSPDGPMTGSVNLSPRGAFVMPSDAEASGWLREIEYLPT